MTSNRQLNSISSQQGFDTYIIDPIVPVPGIADRIFRVDLGVSLSGYTHQWFFLVDENDTLKIHSGSVAGPAPFQIETGAPDGLLVLTEDDVFRYNGSIDITGNYYQNEVLFLDIIKDIVQGIDWQESVLSFEAAQPGSPSVGDRYISSATAGDWTNNYIYEWRAVDLVEQWYEIVPTEGAATWVEDEDKQYVWNGSSWALFGSGVTHNALLSLQGGTTNEYYHLNNSEYTELTQWLDNVALSDDGTLTMEVDIEMGGFGINDLASINVSSGVDFNIIAAAGQGIDFTVNVSDLALEIASTKVATFKDNLIVDGTIVVPSGYINTLDVDDITATNLVTASSTDSDDWADAYGKRVDTWGDGLSYAAQVTSVNVDDDTIEIDTDILRLKADGVDDTHIDFGTGAGQVNTADIPELTNLYYTDERVDDRVEVLIQDGTGISWVYVDGSDTLTPTVSLAPFSTDDLSEGTDLYYTDERVDDRVDELVQDGTGISWNYVDPSGTLTPTVSLSPFSTDDLAEGSNLYYTDERVDDQVDILIQDGTGVSWDYVDASGTLTPTISLSPFDTDDLTEGSDLYYTDARVKTKVQANEAYNITGDWTYTQNITLENDAVIANKKATGITATTDVDTFAQSVGDGAVWHCVIKDGTNFRTSTIQAVWDGTSVEYNEVSTNDIGDTSPLALSVVDTGTDITLRAIAGSGTWEVKAVRTLI